MAVFRLCKDSPIVLLQFYPDDVRTAHTTKILGSQFLGPETLVYIVHLKAIDGDQFIQKRKTLLF